jgi:hypothetical protein
METCSTSFGKSGWKINKGCCSWLEYSSNAFKEYCNRFGIKHEKTVPLTPQHNGIAEIMNHTILEKARSMLSNSGLEKHFWVEAIKTTCYLINQSPTTTLDGGIPEEVWLGKNVNYSHLIFFGCEAFVHSPKEHRAKLDDKSMKYIFFGICKLKLPSSNTIHFMDLYV